MNALLQENCVSAPGQTLEFGESFRFTNDTDTTTICTKFGNFADAGELLSDRPLRKSDRPRRQLTNAELKSLAAKNPPPDEWFEGESERPF